MGQNQLNLSSDGISRLTLVAEGEASLSSGSLRLYAMNSANEAIGAVDLYAYDPINRRCAVGIMVATAHRRRGYALTMLHELADLVATTYHLHQLYADIVATNTASLALFKKAGYTDCGHFRQWIALTDHTYTDTIRMQLLLP